jgi:tRNA(Ile)-lysidine synthase
MRQATCAVSAAIERCAAARAAAPAWLAGFSGGLDSTALLLALADCRERASLPPLSAVHVHHGLHPAADAWADHCASLCARLGVPLTVRRVRVVQRGQGPEAAAREARYGVFSALLPADGVLFLAHHRDDQVETVFLRLLRGAGPEGLAGMPAQRALGGGTLLRPFLDLPRHTLRAYVESRGLSWVDDPGNDDPGPDRNYLRREILPRLERRWPGYRDTVARAAGHLALAARDPREPLVTRCNDFGDPGVDLDELLAAGEAAARCLRQWLRGHGCAPGPSRPLLEFLRQLREAAPGRAPRLEGAGWTLQRFRGAVYLLPRPQPYVHPAPRTVAPGEALTVPGVGRIAVAGPDQGPRPQLQFRRGGERLRLPGAGHARDLKQLLQEAQVPPWWRERLPLLTAAGRVLAAGDRWPAADGDWTLQWDRDGVRYRDVDAPSD